VSSDNYRKIEDALARQRREEEGRQSTLDRAAQESCASLRIADLGNVISDTVKDSERNLIGSRECSRSKMWNGDEKRVALLTFIGDSRNLKAE